VVVLVVNCDSMMTMMMVLGPTIAAGPRAGIIATVGLVRSFFLGSFNDGTTQTALDTLGRGPVRTD
jgi:hypothetical protein